MKKSFLIFLFTFLVTYSFSQTDTSSFKGTIKVQKKGNIHSILYDDVNFRLVGKDVYGNILDSCVIQFRIKTTIKGIAYDEIVQGNTLSKQMQIKLSHLDSGIILFFTEIYVIDKSGNKLKWKDLKAKSGFSLEREY